MRQRSSWLRRIVIWTGPIAAMAVLVVGGFLYWVLATTPGGRWALVTATMQMEGSVSGVSGSVWKGLEIGHLALPVGDVVVDMTDFELQVEWAALLKRQLHIRNVSVGRLDVALTQTDEPKPESEPFVMPDLPIQFRVDRLALDEFALTINGEALPVTVADLTTSLYLDESQGQLRINGLNLGHEQAAIHLEGDFQVADLKAPWPFDAVVQASVQGHGPDSMLCARRYVPTLPLDGTPDDAVATDDTDPATTPVTDDATASGDSPDAVPLTTDNTDVLSDFEACTLDVHIASNGSLNDIELTAQGTGQGMALDAMINLTPSAAFPLQDDRIDLTLADDSSLHAQLDWESQDVSLTPGDESLRDRVSGIVRATHLDVGQLVGSLLPTAILTTSGRFDVQLKDRSQILSSSIELDVAEGSVWNDEPLQGLVKASMHTQDPSSQSSAQPSAPEEVEVANFDWRTVQISDVDIDVHLGQNHVQAAGGFGWSDAALALTMHAPVLSSFWPDLPGGIELDAQLGGSVREHTVSLDGTYTPKDSVPDAIGVAPAQLNLEVAGGWVVVDSSDSSETATRSEGWVGHIRGLDAHHAGLGLVVGQSPSLRVVPGAPGADGLWRLGSATIELSLDKRSVLSLDHEASSGGAGGQWATEGQIGQIVISEALIDDIQQIVGRVPGAQEPEKEIDRGGVKVQGATQATTEIALALDWDLQFDQALAGTLNARYLSGDVMVPAEPPFALGLQTLTLDVSARPLGDGLSQLGADLNVVTADMGRASATIAARLRASPGGGFALEPAGTTVDVNADIEDLGWVSLFAGDAMEFGGQVNADVMLPSQEDGSWDSVGTVTGSNIRIVRIDDGIRLLDGTLSARLENDRFILEKLEFPARLRV